MYKRLLAGIAIAAIPLTTMIPSATADSPVIDLIPVSSVEKTSKTEIIKTEPVKFQTRITTDKDLPNGIEIVTQKGSNGEKTFFKATGETKGKNGKLETYPIYYDDVTKLPVERVILKGTNTEVISGVSEKTKKLEKNKADEKEKAAALVIQKAAEAKAEKERKAAESQSLSLNVPSSGSISSDVPSGNVTSPAENKAFAKSILSAGEFQCANKLIERESGWKTTAENPSSGAYGVPQSLPGNKMASVGSDWRTNGKTQIKWMKNYASERYGSFCGALNHSYSVGWY